MAFKFNPFTGTLDLVKGITLNKVMYVFEDVTERNTYFAANPTLLVEDVLIAIKDSSPPPTPGVRNYDFSKAYNSQYKLTAL